METTTSTEMTTGNDVLVLEKSFDKLKGGGAVLLANQTRAAKALEIAIQIQEQWAKAYAISDPAERFSALAKADERTNNFIVKCNGAIKEMQADRKVYTQLMDMIKSKFTEQENSIDPKKAEAVVKLQQFRDRYAREIHEENERKRRESEAKANRQKENAELRAYIRNAIAQKLIRYIAERKEAITKTFNNIIPETFAEKATALKDMNVSFPENKLWELIKYDEPLYAHHTKEEYEAIRNEEHQAYDFSGFFKTFQNSIAELKQELIDRLPSKKAELEAMAKANAAEKERLEKEKAEREAAEQKRMQEETAAQAKLAEEQAAREKAASQTMALFEQSKEVADATQAPETRQKYEITVKHPAGLVEIFQHWFTNEGGSMNIEEALKKSLNQMKKFCEDDYNKNSRKIESPYLDYILELKAVNRKVK